MKEIISNFVDKNSSFSGSNKYYGYHNEEIMFNLKLWFGENENVNKTVKEVAAEYADQIFKSKTKWQNKVDAVIAMLLNLLVGYVNGANVAISLNSNYYSRTENLKMPEYLSSRNIQRIVKWLLETKRINKIDGYHYHKEYGDYKAGQGKLPQIKLNRVEAEQILSKFSGLGEQKIEVFEYEKGEFSINPTNYFGEREVSPIIEVRSSAKKAIKVEVTSKIYRMGKFLKRYNELMAKTKITLVITIEELFHLEKEEYKKNAKKRDNSFIKLVERVRANLNFPSFLDQKKGINNSERDNNINKERFNSNIALDITKEANGLINIDLDGRLKRVFNNCTITNGGRFYGADYQGIKKQFRYKNLQINGKSVVELDYKSLHLMMCYHLIGINYEGEAYLPKGIPQKLKPAMKVLSLMCINADTKEKAMLAFKNKVDTATLNMIKLNGLTIGKMVKIFENAHEEISNFFYSGEGVRLQALDSEISEKIMKHFLKKKIPVLCMHDSFIVEEQYQDELHQVMKEKYKEVMGFDIKVEVK